MSRKTMFLGIVGLFAFSLGAARPASAGIVIHAAEFGVGKFHRHDDQVHAYGSSAWAPFILGPQAATDHALTVKNADASYTVFFSTLDELIDSITQIAATERAPISVFNLHGHGLPGAMWFPKDANALAGWGCGSWRQAADGSDEDNYDQYYSPVSVSDIETIRSMSDNSSVHTPCTTGLAEWTAALQTRPHFRELFASDAQIHFLSCVVGLGSVGEAFTLGMAQLLLKADGRGRVEASANFGLGDWSMPRGMGFWDYQSDDQVDHDNALYTKDKTDREIAQAGTIRRATAPQGNWTTALIGNLDVMSLAFEANAQGRPIAEGPRSTQAAPKISATRVRVPGTAAYLDIEYR